MSEDDQHSTAVSRRGLLGGVAALSAGAVVGLGGSVASALPPSAQPEALGATNSSLTYLPIDALAFFTASQTAPEGRYSDETSGTGSLVSNRRISASLPLPVGSVIRQLNVSYLGQPIIEVHRRDMAAPNPSALPLQQTLAAAGAGARTQTLDLGTPITIEQAATYTLQFFLLPGDSVYGVTVGYVPPTQAFQPFVGDPRVLDTRLTGGKLAPNEERVIALGFPGARGAVLNVTVADTEGAGFVAVNRAGITWPGNSTLNWSTTGQILSNGVTTALDANGAITIHGGANRTHVIIDRIGWLL